MSKMRTFRYQSTERSTSISGIWSPGASPRPIAAEGFCGLLATLGGRVLEGRFLDSASERYPIVVLGAVAAQRLGVERLSIGGRPVLVYIGGQWFTVGGVLAPLPSNTADYERSKHFPFFLSICYLYQQ